MRYEIIETQISAETTLDVTYLSGLTGSVTFDYIVSQ